MRRAVLLLTLVLPATSAVAEPCPMMGLQPEVLQANATVTGDGGVVVGAFQRARPDGNDKTRTTDGWRFRVGGKLVKPTVDPIAPGLEVLRAPDKATAFSVEDDHHKGVGKARLAATSPALLTAPQVSAIVNGTTKSRHPTTFVDVELATWPPESAIALVVADAKGPARSWGRVVGDVTRTVSVYNTQSGCALTFPDGTVISRPGDRVVTFWVDATGRRSPSSATVVVTEAK